MHTGGLFTEAPLSLLKKISRHGEAPGLGTLNALAARHGIVTGSGAPLRFVVPGGCGLSTAERIWWLGEMEIRPGDWHDCFKALAWLGFPQTKAALNARSHHRAASRLHMNRQPEHKDPLARFDECGIIVATPDLDAWQRICRSAAHDPALADMPMQDRMRVFLFGHASLDLLRTPQIGLNAMAAFLHVDSGWLALPWRQQLADVDARMARRFSSELNAGTCHRSLHDLSLSGGQDVLFSGSRQHGPSHGHRSASLLIASSDNP